MAGWYRVLLVLATGIPLCCSIDTLTYTIVENLEPNTVIGDVKNDAKLYELYLPGDLERLRFSLLESEDPGTDSFTIDDITGLLTLRTPVDRDRPDVCAFRTDCVLSLAVAIGPETYFDVISVNVEILDANDNSPVFSLQEISLNISESSLPGTDFVLPSVSDLDSLDFGIKRFQARPNTGQFDIRWSRDVQGNVQPKLEMRERLDREEISQFDITVVALDGGAPPRTGELLIHVHIQDSNDNAPRFPEAGYDQLVSEDVPLNSVLLAVKAEDPDVGHNSRLHYSFSPATRRNYGGTFDLDPNNGDITLISGLDREQEDIYYLVVIARDSGKDSLEATATVTLRIDDVNDNVPSVRVSVLTPSGRAEVAESADPGTFVALVSVTDRDLGRNSEVTCSLVSDKFALQELQRNKYTVVTTGVLDYETTTFYRLTMRCHDNGAVSLASEESLMIYVTDSNDHDPVFTNTEQPISVYVSENNAVGVSLIQMNATDRDSGDNSRLTFSLTENPRQLFRIDPSSGVLYTNAIFDYETENEFRIEVSVADHGDPPRTTTSYVLVRVVDENDQAPVFSTQTYKFRVLENQPPPVIIGNVSATDGDSAPFNQIRYLLRNSEHTEMFSINPDTGTITLLRELDRETRATYSILVYADNDGSDSSLSGSAMVTLEVADVNDNAPVIHFPRPGNDIIQVSRYLPIGYKVVDINASDADSGENATLSYFLFPAAHAQPEVRELLSVDLKSGEVLLMSDLSDIDVDSVQYQIMVRDGGSTQLVSTANFTIIINQSLPFIPVFPEQTADDNQGTTGGRLIVIIVVSVTCVLIIVLLAAIGFILLKSRRSRRENDKIDPAIKEIREENEFGMDFLEKPKDPEKSTLANIRRHDSLEKKHLQISDAGPGMTALPVYVESETDSGSPSSGGLYVSFQDNVDTSFLSDDKHQKMAPAPSPQSLQSDADLESSTSGDSGRGASEEGESQHVDDHGYGPENRFPRSGLNSSFPYVKTSSPIPEETTDDVAHDTKLDPRDQYGSGNPVYPATLDARTVALGNHGNAHLHHNAYPHYHPPTNPPTVWSCPVHGKMAPNVPATPNPNGQTQPPNQNPGRQTPTNHSLGRQTVRNVKAKDRSKKAEFISNSDLNTLNNCLNSSRDLMPDVQSMEADGNAAYNFSDASSLLKYKTAEPNRCPSEMTDATTTTSGSYVIQTEDAGVFLDDVTRSQIEV